MANGSLQPAPQIVVPGSGWVDVASRAIVQVGFPVVVAAVLLWFLLTKFQENMNAIATRMGNNTEAAARLVEAASNEYAEIQKQSAEMAKQTAILQQIAADGHHITEVRARELEQFQAISKQLAERPRH